MKEENLDLIVNKYEWEEFCKGCFYAKNGYDPMENDYQDKRATMIYLYAVGEETLKEAISGYIKNPNSEIQLVLSEEVTKTSSEYKKIIERSLKYLLIATILISISSTLLHLNTIFFNPPIIYYILQYCAAIISLLLYIYARIIIEHPKLDKKYMEEQFNSVKKIEKYWNFPFYSLALSFVFIVLWIFAQYIV